MLNVRTMQVVGGPLIGRTFLLHRCLACRRSFDEIEAEEGQDLTGRTFLTPYRRRGYIQIKMWFVAGVLTVVAVILGAVGIRIKTTRR